jgi:hypothetical protein
MKAIAGLIVVLCTVILMYFQLGGNKSIYTLYEMKGQAPDLLSLPKDWPPTLDKPYPDLALVNQNGEYFNLSNLKGAVLVILPIDFNNMQSVALENIRKYGSYSGIPSDQNTLALVDKMKNITPKLKLPQTDLIFVHLIFHNQQGNKASINDAIAWAKHFKLKTKENHVVAVPTIEIPDYASDGIISGAHLVDRGFILRADATGVAPKHSLDKILIPMIPVALENQ